MASADVAAPPAASSEGSTTTTTTGSEKQHQQVKQDTDKTAGKQDESTPQRPGQGSREQPVQLTLDALLGGNGKDSSKDEQQQQQQPRKLNLSAMDAKSYPESTADSGETFGTLNQHPRLEDGKKYHFKVGVSTDKNQSSRRTMEDSHSFVYDYGAVRGQGFFAVFDGHAGPQAAEYCGQYFHEHLLSTLVARPDLPVPDQLNETFHIVDGVLARLARDPHDENATSPAGGHVPRFGNSGCTAVVAFLRLEDEDGKPVGTTDGQKATGQAVATVQPPQDENDAPIGESAEGAGSESPKQRQSMRDKVRDFIRGAGSGSGSSSSDFTNSDRDAGDGQPGTLTVGETERAIRRGEAEMARETGRPAVRVAGPADEPAKRAAKRTLYTANVGDARAVLSRGGRAVRLTYDHKGSDAKEAKRITDAGGFVMNNRVNGVLAVTRSLGDSAMKEFVVGSPYTTETTLGENDDYLIVACDGLWDVCDDQQAVDIVRDAGEESLAAKRLLEHALANFSSDNLSVMVVKLF